MTDGRKTNRDKEQLEERCVEMKRGERALGGGCRQGIGSCGLVKVSLVLNYRLKRTRVAAGRLTRKYAMVL